MMAPYSQILVSSVLISVYIAAVISFLDNECASKIFTCSQLLKRRDRGILSASKHFFASGLSIFGHFRICVHLRRGEPLS